MDNTVKRIGAYGLGAVVVAGLSYLGFVYEPDADPMTLLGSANVQIELARSFPEKDRQGNPNSARVEILRNAGDFIARARRQDPDLHAAIELEAHLAWMHADYKKAAGLFAEALSSPSATPETSVIDRLNEARMWRAANEPEKALAILDELNGFLEQHLAATQMQRAHLMFETEKFDEAIDIATRISRSSTNPDVLVDAGLLLESRNETAAAATAYVAAASSEPLANYYLARLKIREKDFDTGVDLLKRAVAANERRVRIMLSRDAKAWESVAEDERFKDLVATDAAAGPGR